MAERIRVPVEIGPVQIAADAIRIGGRIQVGGEGTQR
jgi:hypothetical protein